MAAGHGGARSGAGRKPGSGWRPAVRNLRESAIAAMQAVVGSERDPLAYCCELAADPSQDAQLRLSAASVALPYLYPRLSATTVDATHTTVKVDAAEMVAQLEARIARLAPPPPEPLTVEGEQAA